MSEPNAKKSDSAPSATMVGTDMVEIDDDIPKRSFWIGKRKIMVFEDVLPVSELSRLQRAFAMCSYARMHQNSHDHGGRWVTEIEAATEPTLGLRDTETRLLKKFVGPRQKLVGASCDSMVYGEQGWVHEEAYDEGERFRFLWYICDRWEPNWGGEMIFFNSDDDAVFVVAPRPGRLILLDSSVKFVRRPPTRVCHQSNLVIQMEYCVGGSEVEADAI